MESTIRRFEREAVIACLVLAAVGAASGRVAAVPRRRPVLGGGALAAFSYLGLKAAVNLADSGTKSRSWPLVKFFTRNAILAFVAYVMLARLRLHPVGVIVGATSMVVAAWRRGDSNDRVVLSSREFPLAVDGEAAPPTLGDRSRQRGLRAHRRSDTARIRSRGAGRRRSSPTTSRC